MSLWLFAFAFGLVAAEPGADHSAELLAGAPPDADVAIYYNAEATAQPAWEFVRSELPKETLLKSVPEAKEGLDAFVAEVERELKEMDATFGVEPLDDVKFGGAWVGIRKWENGEPSDFSFLLAVHGDFEDDLLSTTVATLGPQLAQTTIDGVTAWTMTEKKLEIAVAQLDGGVVIAGTRDWVEMRIAGKKQSGDQASRLRKKISSGAVMILDVVPSASTRTRLTSDVDNQSAGELLGGFDVFSMTAFADGMDMEIDARSDALYTRYHHLALGSVEAMRAGRSGARAFAYLLVGIVSPNDPSFPTELSAAMQQPTELMALVDVLVGSGEIVSNDRSKKKTRRVVVEARAGHLRQLMLPFGLLAVVLIGA